MSDSMPLPSMPASLPAVQPSIWDRLRTTPLSDVLRGRLTGRLAVLEQIHSAGLPVPVATHVADVVHRTRLWRTEKAEVARELISHFADGLDTGRTSEELLRDFGEASQAGR